MLPLRALPGARHALEGRIRVRRALHPLQPVSIAPQIITPGARPPLAPLVPPANLRRLVHHRAKAQAAMRDNI
jgi:hypothetical protein